MWILIQFLQPSSYPISILNVEPDFNDFHFHRDRDIPHLFWDPVARKEEIEATVQRILLWQKKRVNLDYNSLEARAQQTLILKDKILARLAE